MSASLESLPVELIEHICNQDDPPCPDHNDLVCNHDGHLEEDCGAEEHWCITPVTLSLREVCSELERKTFRIFKLKWFTTIPVIAAADSINLLLEIALSPTLRFAVKCLRFSLYDHRICDTEFMPAKQCRFVLSGSFSALLELTLAKLPHCRSIIFGTEKIFLRRREHTWDTVDIMDVWERMRDYSAIFLGICRAIASKEANVTELLFEYHYDPDAYVAIDEIHRHSKDRTCAALSLPSLERLSRSFGDDYHYWGTSEFTGSPHECEDTGKLAKSQAPCGYLLGSFLGHLPRLKCLELHTFVVESCWLPKTFGAHLEELTLHLHSQDYCEFPNNAQSLVTTLQGSPHLKRLCFGYVRFSGPPAAKSLFSGLANLTQLRSVELPHSYFEDGKMCLFSGCTRDGRDSLRPTWQARRLPQDLLDWQSLVHAHE